MRLGMTLNVRDEADIIVDNLRFHAAQGVDFFVVADHGSTDGTADLLDPYVEAGLVHRVEVEATDILDLHETHMTRLARIAGELGADWILHNDADEFWWPLTGDLKQAFESIGPEYGLMLVPRTEFPPRLGEGPWTERMQVRERRSRHRPKLAHRPHPDVRIHGVHPDNLWVDSGGRPGYPGPPKMRAERPAAVSGPEIDLVLAPTFPIRIFHVPLRSFEQYRKRIEIALQTEEIWGKRGASAREDWDAGRLRERYAALTLSEADVEAGLADGSLVEDRELAEYLAACPDPIAGGEAPPGAGAWTAERRRAELDELLLDAMASVSIGMQKHARENDPEVARRQERRRRRRARKQQADRAR